MKKLTFLIFSIIFFIASCDHKLDIEPRQAISTEVALSTEQGVKTALIGTYQLLTNVPRFTGDILLNSELLIDAGNLFWTGYSFDLSQIFDKRITVNSAAVETFWINSYRVINQTNSILSALEVVGESDRQAVAAEARFLRGLVYFDLVNLYGKSWGDGDPATNLGVPIVSTPSEQNLNNPIIPRNTVAEVYQFILDDLLFAKANLPEQNGIFAATYAASVLISRVYLMQEQYESAAMEADRVIEEGGYSLLPDLTQVFNASENTSEDIFALQYTPQDLINNTSYFYSGELEGGGGFVGITDEHLAKYEPGDKRSTLFYLDKQNGIRRTAKWKPNAAKDGNVTLIRLAEVYLTRAESRFRTGDATGARQDLNTIRQRAGLPELTLSGINLEIILKERFLELVFEGHQYRDTKRNKQSVGDLPFNDARLIYPIPQREMDVNEALVQNTGY